MLQRRVDLDRALKGMLRLCCIAQLMVRDAQAVPRIDVFRIGVQDALESVDRLGVALGLQIRLAQQSLRVDEMRKRIEQIVEQRQRAFGVASIERLTEGIIRRVQPIHA